MTALSWWPAPGAKPCRRTLDGAQKVNTLACFRQQMATQGACRTTHSAPEAASRKVTTALAWSSVRHLPTSAPAGCSGGRPAQGGLHEGQHTDLRRRLPNPALGASCRSPRQRLRRPARGNGATGSAALPPVCLRASRRAPVALLPPPPAAAPPPRCRRGWWAAAGWT